MSKQTLEYADGYSVDYYDDFKDWEKSSEAIPNYTYMGEPIYTKSTHVVRVDDDIVAIWDTSQGKGVIANTPLSLDKWLLDHADLRMPDFGTNMEFYYDYGDWVSDAIQRGSLDSLSGSDPVTYCQTKDTRQTLGYWDSSKKRGVLGMNRDHFSDWSNQGQEFPTPDQPTESTTQQHEQPTEVRTVRNIKQLCARHKQDFDHVPVEPGERFLGAPFQKPDDPNWYQWVSRSIPMRGDHDGTTETI